MARHVGDEPVLARLRLRHGLVDYATWFDYFYVRMGNAYNGYRGDGVAENNRPMLSTVSKDQLKKPSSGSPALTMPKEYKGILKAIESGVKRGDARILETLRAGIQPGFMGRDNGRRLGNPPAPRNPGNAHGSLGIPRFGRAQPADRSRLTDGHPACRLEPGRPPRVAPRCEHPLFERHDTKVVCPELKLSSGMMARGQYLAERGSVRSSGGSSSGSGGGSSTSGGSMSTGGSSSSGSSAGAASSSGGGGGGHIR